MAFAEQSGLGQGTAMSHLTDGMQRLRITARGAVQGVGFRPFVFRLATELGLRGWVLNSSSGVFVEVEGPERGLHEFLLRVERDKPPRASIQSLEYICLDPVGYDDFAIRDSVGGEKTALIMPDIAMCPDCLAEIRDPGNRRHRYPFTNCTHCGPRFTIIESLPYDRPNTTMRAFTMCEACRAEYENPLDRRFHAQPNACPVCGPRLAWWDSVGDPVTDGEEALAAAVQAILDGLTVAVKGLGGFHLMTDARSDEAVRRLRRAKAREEKPFAVMLPSMEWARRLCVVSELEERALLSPESPIVLLRQGSAPGVSEYVAPGNPNLGVLLPYTPLHHLLLADLGFPVVATSGNRADEPICRDEHEAVARLEGLADFFLVHNRPIARHADDSIVRILLGREQVFRRARGYAPLPIQLSRPGPSILAVGAHLKNAVALSVGAQAFVSQHIGDLETAAAYDAFREATACLGRLYDAKAEQVACDIHPDYLSTQYAQGLEVPAVAVQHHYAHVLSCMAENDLEGSVLGVAWDGTGYGPDGTIWGGEFLHVTDTTWRRVGQLRTFPLPGGDRAIREPRRSALGVLYEMLGDDAFEQRAWTPARAFTAQELRLLRVALRGHMNCPRTSSVGRLFDAASALARLRNVIRFEGQAAMDLEFSIVDGLAAGAYACEMIRGAEGGMPSFVVDWAPVVRDILDDAMEKRPTGLIAARFHNALVEAIVNGAELAGEERVVLTGGCFQNGYLTERAVVRLRERGFRPYWHQRIPPNDGGVALGQLAAAAMPRTAL